MLYGSAGIFLLPLVTVLKRLFFNSVGNGIMISDYDLHKNLSCGVNENLDDKFLVVFSRIQHLLFILLHHTMMSFGRQVSIVTSYFNTMFFFHVWMTTEKVPGTMIKFF